MNWIFEELDKVLQFVKRSVGVCVLLVVCTACIPSVWA